MEKLTVGQKIWYVPTHRHQGEPRELTITRVARKYAYSAAGWYELRIDMSEEQLRVVDRRGDYFGRGYLDRAAYERSVATQKAWSDFKQYVHPVWNVPEHLTLEQIKLIHSQIDGSVCQKDETTGSVPWPVPVKPEGWDG